MATVFRNKVINTVGVVPIDIYETDASTRATVIGLSLTNLTQSFVYVDVLVQDDTSVTGYYLKETLLPANTSLRVVATGEKLIIAPSNKLQVRSSIDDSVDVVASIVEIV
jgi:multisubunit Na+/H+ antiporter MnhE subunit